MDWAADPPPSWAVFPQQPNDLNHYQVGDLVFCKATVRAIEPFWPGKLIDPIEAPSAVRASCVPDAVCVMFYGPATIKKTRPRLLLGGEGAVGTVRRGKRADV